MARKLRGAVLTSAVVLALTAPAVAAPPADPEIRELKRHVGQTAGSVQTSTDAAREKIHPDLERTIARAPETKPVGFIARIAAGTDLNAYSDRYFVRPFVDPLGSTVAVGYAKPAGILKLATLPGVLTVQRQESIVEPPEPVDHQVRRAERQAINATVDPDRPSPGPAPQGWHHTTGQIHGSQEAWDKGYTGAGVRYMSNDSGADYCHPDLDGTWQYIDDESSPYHGLPQMFDGISVLLSAFDFYLGEQNVTAGLADYADTSHVVSAGPRPPVGAQPRFETDFQPLGAESAHTYTVPMSSRSGDYHLGSHPDKALAANAALLSESFGDATAVENERAAVLVTDEEEAGVYDTVYVDLDYDFDFTDERPARLTRDFSAQETACLDYDGDGLNDVSGGLVYFISDGQTPIPTMDWYWGVPGDFYGNGDLVAFHVQDFMEAGGSHGQGTTSVATGQGVVRGNVFTGPDGPPQAGGQGLVVGPGKDVRSTQNGNFYADPLLEDGFLFAALGYDGTVATGDDTQIISNSWGSSDIDNDGWDFSSRLIDSIIRYLAPRMSSMHSTGNGAPGYGTSAPPSPLNGIGIGASTQYGSIGLFEPIASADQIVGGDVMTWSNRGPGATGSAGVDVVATGAWGTGDLSLNQTLWGAIATSNFGGTSMSAPVAAGNLALVYDAWRERTGAWPTTQQAKDLLMGSSRNTDHDVFSQGAGIVDADRGTDAATGGAAYVSPGNWRVGDYRGTEYPAFGHVIAPGESDEQTFTVHNHGDEPMDVRLRSNTQRRIGTQDYSFTTEDVSLDHGEFTVPDYVFRIDPDVPRRTDLLQVRVTKPYEQFDPDEDLEEPFSNWSVQLHNWTDLDRDGDFWVDEDGNDKVSVTRDDDGNLVDSEMDENEYIRFNYGYNYGPNQEVRVANPRQRIDDGLLLAFSHSAATEEVRRTDLDVEASMWRRTSWNWLRFDGRRLRVPPGESVTFTARLRVPRQAEYGTYEGAILVQSAGWEGTIPVSVAVAADGTGFDFGGEESRLPASLYDNGALFGHTNYSWRAESGDWRFFWTDVADGALPEEGTNYLVVDNDWEHEGTDVDTIVLGPTPDCFSTGGACENGGRFTGDPDVYGPYTLGEVGGSVDTHIGSGRWRYQTSSGTSREIIAAEAWPGLHGILLHQVRVDGSEFDEPFEGDTGAVNINPGVVSGTSEGEGSSAEVTVTSGLDLDGLRAEGFGLSRPVTTEGTVGQDDPNDPSTASFTQTVTLEHAGELVVSTGGAEGNDLDLYLYGPDGELLASSTTPADEERVALLLPPDGEYTIAVHGWSVPAGSTTFNLTVDAVQGFDVEATDVPESIDAGESATFTVNWNTAGKEPGDYRGLVFLGPEAAPGLFQIPVRVTVE